MGLRVAIAAKQHDIRANPANAFATFSADSRQVALFRSQTNIRQFSLTIDEPERLGGSDAAPNPAELVSAALAACREVTYRADAEALGIPLENVSVRVEIDFGLRGSFAANERVRAGLQNVRETVRLSNSADKHCPVLDILQAGIPVTLDLAPVSRPVAPLIG